LNEENTMRHPAARLLLSLFSACALLAPALASSADAYPSKTVTIVVPYPPGGGADILARTLGQKLGAIWGRSVVVDNRAGAGGSIGTAYVAKAPADGYTLLMASPSHTINASLYKNLPFDAMKSFAPIVLCASGPLVLVVPSKSPLHSLKDFMHEVHANAGGINFASAGAGSSPHLAGELFNNMAKVKMVHVAYKGTAPALTDLLGGQVQAMFAPVPTIISYVKSGTLRALAVTSAKPFSALPGVPAVADELPGYEVLQWWGLVAPAGTPPAVVAKVNADVAAVLRTPDMQEKLATIGADAGGQPPASFTRLMDDEIPKWAKVVKAANVQPE
jgi:tripartite-type tricarboxylate transporter receptor subunit TctC